MELKLCHLYPDVLNLYGDRGNILCMQQRLRRRGIEVTVEGVSIGEPLDAGRYDLFFIGGGQDFEQEVLLRDLAGAKTAAIRAAAEDGKVFLAICGGYQMLGNYYKTWDGQQCDFTGVLDLWTIGGKKRMIGNYAFACDDLGGDAVVGFENHSGKTYLGTSLRPMGRVLAGYGNNGEDKTEGVRWLNVYGTYSHGCLLPKNPKLADAILRTALQRKYGQAELAPLDDELEQKAHDTVLRRIVK